MMKVRWLTEREKQNSRALWEVCFPEDSRSFVDYYYQEKVRDNRILAVTEPREDGRIVSMLHLNPYDIHLPEKDYRLDYIVGVATHPQQRHQGHMRSLLTVMMKEMYGRRVPFTYLMPANPRIYEPFDFAYVFRQPQFKLLPAADGQLRRAAVPGALAGAAFGAGGKPDQDAGLLTAAAFMETFLAKRFTVFARRDEAYVRRLLDELRSENGGLNFLYDQDRLVGLEGYWGLHQRESRLLYAEESYLCRPVETKPAIMARIICLAEFVRQLGLQPDMILDGCLLGVRDEFLAGNQGLYRWQAGGDRLELAKVSECIPAEADCLTIRELTGWLFGEIKPEELDLPRELSARLRAVAPLGKLFLDEIV